MLPRPGGRHLGRPAARPVPPTSTTLLHRALILVATTVALLAQAARLDAVLWNLLGLPHGWPDGGNAALATAAGLDTALTVVTGGAALLLTFRGADRPGGPSLASALAAWSYLLAYPALTLLVQAAGPAAAVQAAFEGHFVVVEFLGLGALLRFSAVFPRPLRAGDLVAAADLAPALRPLQRVRAALLTPPATWGASLALAALALAANRWLGRPPQDAALLPFVDLVRFAALALVVVNMRRSYLSATAADRRRLHWIALGFTALLACLGVLVGGNVLVTVAGWTVPLANWRPLVLALGVAGLIGGAVRSVLDAGRGDPLPVLRRAAVLALAVLATLLLAAALEALLSDAVVARLSLPRGLGTASALVAMGVVYVRTRRPLEGLVDQAWRGLPLPDPRPDDAEG